MSKPIWHAIVRSFVENALLTTVLCVRGVLYVKLYGALVACACVDKAYGLVTYLYTPIHVRAAMVWSLVPSSLGLSSLLNVHTA